jgi:hypothetical protein
MKTIAFFLQLVLLLFFILFLILFIFHDSLGTLVGMDPITSVALGKIFLTGTILFLLSWVASAFRLNALENRLKKKEAELNAIKAKIYDLEHPKAASITSKPVPQKNQDEQSGILRPRQNFTDQ